MDSFRDVKWYSRLVEEKIKDRAGTPHISAHYVISDSKTDWAIPFTFEEWCKQVGININVCVSPENIYRYCSEKLTRPFCKQMVFEAATRLECDPGFVQPYEKMASFYILRLLANIPRKMAWSEWHKIPITDGLLKDEVFCLCLMALHPVLYGKLHPHGRNNRRVALEAIARWDLPSFSMLQFVHPYAMRKFNGKDIHPNSIGYKLQSHIDSTHQYWLFDDYSVITRVIGRPGKRKWHELEYAGPSAVARILSERKQHKSSNDALMPYVEKNQYI
jgi:hypothetical protein